MKIVITDSGLGGISVCSEIEKLAYQKKSYSELELIFFNSLPDNGFGYNSMKSEIQKAEVFNSALESMYNNFNPDSILIACNTLTAVYPNTTFSRKNSVPVIGVIKYGFELAFSEFCQNKDSQILILGTPTTINSNVYQNLLKNAGVDDERIIGQPCFSLESEIQINPFSDKVQKLIEKYLAEAKEKITSEFNNLIVVLGCTHYGYSIKIFEQVLTKLFSSGIKIINPNHAMAEDVFAGKNGFYDSTKVSVKVISQAAISDEEKFAIGNLIKDVAPQTFKALMNPIINKNLFQYRIL